MRISRRYLTRGVYALFAVYVVITATMIASLLSKHNCYDITQEDTLSVDNIDHWVLKVLSDSEVLKSEVDRTLKSEQLHAESNTQAILEDLRDFKKVMHQMEKHIDERAMKMMLSQPIINYHNYSYIHNPKHYCTENNVEVILIIPSAATNFEKRQRARKGQRQKYVHNVKNRAKMLFFLGRPPQGETVTIQHSIGREALEFGDVVQEDFEDVYKNNRLKSVSMLRWVSTYCSKARYVLRTDDDIEVNVSALIPVMYQTSQILHNFIIGKKRINDPPRRDSSKYYISETEYPYFVFPPYLLGGLLGYPVSTAKLLYEAALRVHQIWLEDVYITGMCASKMHIQILENPKFVFEHE